MGMRATLEHPITGEQVQVKYYGRLADAIDLRVPGAYQGDSYFELTEEQAHDIADRLFHILASPSYPVSILDVRGDAIMLNPLFNYKSDWETAFLLKSVKGPVVFH